MDYFTKVPNKYIRCNLVDKFGISRKFFIIYILIDQRRSRGNTSWLTLKCVLDFYNIKIGKNKPKAVHEIINVLKFMVSRRMIDIDTDLDSLLYNTCIKISINPDIFDVASEYTVFTFSQYEQILLAEKPYNRESVLLSFLYINSFIGMNKKPAAFWGSIQKMSDELGISKKSIYQSIDFLTSSIGTIPLLIKNDSSCVFSGSHKTPNIYTLNTDDYMEDVVLARNILSNKTE